MANEFKVKKGLIVQGSGSTLLDIQGSQGQLFSVTDSLSGSLFSVNDISGMPIMEVFSDDRVLLGTFNAEAIKVSGSTASVTGSLLGTASFAVTSSFAISSSNALTASFVTTAQTASYVLNAISASFASTASSVNTLNQNVLVTGSVTIGATSAGASENTLTLGARDTTNEGGQIGFNAPGGTYTSASFIDNWQNKHRILKGNNTTSTALIAQWDIHTTQLQLPGYTAASSFPGTATANLAVDSGGNVITVSTSGGSVFPYTGNAVITGSLTTTGIIYAQPNGGMYFQGGDDAALYDVNVVNTMGIYGVQDSTVGAIRLGSNGPVLYGSGSSLGIGTTNPSSASLTVTGNVWATSFTGSLQGNASSATTAVSASFANTASWATNVINNGVTSVSASGTVSGITLGGGPITSTGTLTLSGTISGLTNSNLSGTAGITNANLATPSLMIGTTNIALGATGSSLAGLSSVTATSFTGSFSGSHFGPLTGTASYATQALSASFASTAGTVVSISANIVDNTNNYILTATGGSTIQGESALTFNGSLLTATGNGENIRINSSDTNGSYMAWSNNTTAKGYIGSAYHLFAGPDNLPDNFGIRANNSLAISAGGSGVKMFVSSSGNVGIGTTTPNTKLDVNGNAIITGSLTVTGRITAEEFHTEFVSSSIIYLSGSTKFGDSLDDVMSVTGSLRVNGGITGSLFGTSSWAVSSSYATVAQSVSGTITNALTASYVNQLIQPVVITGSFNQGVQNTITGTNAHAQGLETMASGSYSHAEGRDTLASGIYSHAEGYFATASGTAAHAEGISTLASGEYSHTEGYGTLASTLYAHAEGYFTTASGQQSHAEGNTTIASGNSSHAEGNSTQAKGQNSHAEGYVTTASGSHSHAEGNTTIAIGAQSHTEGGSTVAFGIASHAEGSGTRAVGDSSHAEGDYSHAGGRYSHAEGRNTSASGEFSHAEGEGAIALQTGSHAEGYYTVASGSYQHVQGQFNISSSAQSAFIIGNGTNVNSRSNLVFASGSIFQVTGSVSATQGFTGSLFGTASWAVSASWAPATGTAATASFVTSSNVFGPNGSNSILSASFARTASGVTVATSTAGSDFIIPFIDHTAIVPGTYPFLMDDSNNATFNPASSTLSAPSIYTQNYILGYQIYTQNNIGIYDDSSDIALGDYEGNATNAGVSMWSNGNKVMSVGHQNAYISHSLGIGTTGPSSSLDVRGVIRGLYTPDPSTGAITGKFLSYEISPYGLIFRGYSSGVHSIQSQREGNDSQLYGLSLQPLGGNVGIGTTSPTLGTLEVAGNVYATSFTGSLFGTSSWAVSASWAPSAGLTGGTTNYVPLWTSTTALSSSAIYQSTNKVGIGTTVPLYTLDVSGSINLPSTERIHWNNGSGSIFFNNGDNFVIATWSGSLVNRMVVTSAGNVGIGKTNPATALDITGSAVVTGSLRVTQGITGSLQGTASYASQSLSASFATAASTITITNDNATNTTYYPIFTTGISGNLGARVDNATLTYNPGTNTLTTTTFAGNATTATTASNATNATNVTITTQDTTPVTYNITFTGGTSGNNALGVDSTTLTYNPSTSTFTTPIVNSTTAVRGGNGSAGAPALSFSGDTDTGIYNAAANVVGIAGGGVAVALISQSGFHMQGAGSKTIELTANSAGDTEIVFAPNTTGGTGGNLHVNHPSLPLIFKLNSTERWRIATAGTLQSNGASTIQTSTGNLTLATAAGNGHILLNPNGTGAVGINQSSPQGEFHVYQTTNLGGTTGNNLILQTLQNTGGAGGNLVYVKDYALRDATGTDWTTWRHHNSIDIDGSHNTPGTNTKAFYERDPLSGLHEFGQEATYAVTIDGVNSRLGIGTRTPNVTLEVNGQTRISQTGLEYSSSISTSAVNGELAYWGGGSVTAGNVYFYSSTGNWELADADAAVSSSGMLGIAKGTGTASAVGMLLRGHARFTGVTSYTGATTIGAPLYVSQTAGAFTQTAPTGTGKVVRIIGYVQSTANDQIYFCPDTTWVELA